MERSSCLGRVVVRAVACLLVGVFACDNSSTTPPPTDSIFPIPEPEHLLVDNFPAWSPDGGQVAYHRQVPSASGPAGMYIINVDGTDERLLLEGNLSFPREIRFAPDGERLSVNVGWDIFVFTLVDGTLQQITFTGGRARSADWSPDGESLVFSEGGFLKVVDVGSGAVVALVDSVGPLVGSTPRWSPQEDLIAFSSGDRSDSQDIFTARSGGSSLHRATDVPYGTFASDPRWFRAGTHILYSRLENGNLTTRVMARDGSDDSPWPLLIGFHDAISFDGDWVVTSGAQDDSVAVLFVRRNRDTDDFHQLTSYHPVRK